SSRSEQDQAASACEEESFLLYRVCQNEGWEALVEHEIATTLVAVPCRSIPAVNSATTRAKPRRRPRSRVPRARRGWLVVGLPAARPSPRRSTRCRALPLPFGQPRARSTAWQHP